MLEKLKKYMTLFQWAEVLAIIAFTVYFALTNTTNPWWYILIDSLAAVCGVFCVVLCAGGKKSQYYWGFVNISAYIVIALINKYYGEVMLNALYYLPTQFIGLRAWNRHYKEQEDQVEGLRMDLKHIAVWGLCSVAGIFVYKLILDAMGGNATLLDSMSTVFSIVANALMVLRYREQWMLWIIVDVVTVIMWALAGDLLMTVMWSIYLINAVYGLIMWSYEQFIRDAGFQYYIITRCGLKIGRIFIVTHGPDKENPFVPVDVTQQAKGYYRWINDNIWDLNRMQKESEEVQVEPGDQCCNPYECWYYGYCHKKHASPQQMSMEETADA